MNIETKNKLIIISSPSGAGKTTLCKLLLKKMNKIKLSVSYTSRNKRLNEEEGKDYYFVTEKKFHNLKKNNYFIETAKNELKKRLIKRGRDNTKEINLRLSYAISEMKHYKEYKFVLINENVYKTVNEIRNIIQYNELIFNNKFLLNKKLKTIINI